MPMSPEHRRALGAAMTQVSTRGAEDRRCPMCDRGNAQKTPVTVEEYDYDIHLAVMLTMRICWHKDCGAIQYSVYYRLPKPGTIGALRPHGPKPEADELVAMTSKEATN